MAKEGHIIYQNLWKHQLRSNGEVYFYLGGHFCKLPPKILISMKHLKNPFVQQFHMPKIYQHPIIMENPKTLRSTINHSYILPFLLSSHAFPWIQIRVTKKKNHSSYTTCKETCNKKYNCFHITHNRS